jgi:hypothetical protein
MTFSVGQAVHHGCWKAAAVLPESSLGVVCVRGGDYCRTSKGAASLETTCCWSVFVVTRSIYRWYGLMVGLYWLFSDNYNDNAYVR